MHPSEVASSVVGHRFPGYMDYPGAGLRPLPVERKWALGLQVWRPRDDLDFWQK